jgi:outer membrane lipoprotein-sorting protein
MTNFLRTGFIAIALTFVFSAFAVSETNAQINKVLTLMDSHYKALQTLQSSITMAKYNSQLDETDMSQGSVWYVPASNKEKMAIRLDWDKPTVEYLAVTKGRYILYRPRLKQAYVGTVDKAKGNSTVAGPLSFMSMSKAELNKNYSVVYIGKEKLSDGSWTAHLELTPRAAQKYKLADIWIDDDGMPLQAKIVEKNNDSTTVLLTDLVKNKTIDGSIFTIELPPNVKPIPN